MWHILKRRYVVYAALTAFFVVVSIVPNARSDIFKGWGKEMNSLYDEAKVDLSYRCTAGVKPNSQKRTQVNCMLRPPSFTERMKGVGEGTLLLLMGLLGLPLSLALILAPVATGLLVLVFVPMYVWLFLARHDYRRGKSKLKPPENGLNQNQPKVRE